ncbi:MAG: hypothetical protein U1F43_28990 [Myxococcota bacterium]
MDGGWKKGVPGLTGVVGALACALVCGSASALVGCDDGASGAERAAFAGPIAETDLALGVAIDGDHVMAYLCGGATAYASDTRWFSASLDADDSFRATSDGWSIVGDRAGQGTLTGPRGETLTFAPAAAVAPAGLYRNDDGPCPTGLVVWKNAAGELRAQGVWCDGQGGYGQVTPMMPLPWDATGAAAVLPQRDGGPGDTQFLTPLPPAR